MRETARLFGLDPELVSPCRYEEMEEWEGIPRDQWWDMPENTNLDSSKVEAAIGHPLASFAASIARMQEDIKEIQAG